MRLNTLFLRFALAFLLATSGVIARVDGASVWKVTGPNGGTLYLGGSIHALHSTEYPLPPAYNRAFDASTRLSFEVDRQALRDSSKGLVKAGEYPPGDSLKNHVDPRTYAYVKRYFALVGVPEQKFSTYRPWLIAAILESAPKQNFMLGVERFFQEKAAAAHKPIESLESIQEHMAPFVGLSEREGEALLLIHFINLGRTDLSSSNMMGPWRRGDADSLARQLHDVYREFPAFADRLLGQRNRRWIPRIEGYLKSGQVYFVIAGAGHMGGSDGVIALLRSRGYVIEQL